jgi:hypothetical protein
MGEGSLQTVTRGFMSSPRRLARIAGRLYLMVGIIGSFAIAYVTAKVSTYRATRP